MALVEGTGCPVDYAPMALWITVLRTCRLRSRCSLRISGFAAEPLVEGDEVQGTKRPKGQRDVALVLAKRPLAVLYMLRVAQIRHTREKACVARFFIAPS